MLKANTELVRLFAIFQNTVESFIFVGLKFRGFQISD